MMTVREIRAAIEGLPDDAPVWGDTGDAAVSVSGFRQHDGRVIIDLEVSRRGPGDDYEDDGSYEDHEAAYLDPGDDDEEAS